MDYRRRRAAEAYTSASINFSNAATACAAAAAACLSDLPVGPRIASAAVAASGAAYAASVAAHAADAAAAADDPIGDPSADAAYYASSVLIGNTVRLAVDGVNNPPADPVDDVNNHLVEVSATSPTDDGGVICDDRLISGRGRFSIGKPTALESPSLGSPSLRRVLAAARRCLPGGAACPAPGAAWTAPGPTWPPPGRCLAGVWLATARRVAGHCQALAGRRLAAGVGLAVANRRLPLQLKKKPKIMQQHLDYCFPGLWLSKITPRSYKANE
ncbi:hypothetical protein ZIOFF_030208 [Zingiber officinale]|uniref:Uncharacterized protein n=1 Tax=Zingiber officinale TaxID=94328 RepID=A0A8J5LHI3_ZINOF|nr:hypothetical protein ZIOFF_030208 [Zingiber officinale]